MSPEELDELLHGDA